MSASIVTLSNLGKKTNLKTADILPVIEKFSDERILTQIICQINTGFPFVRTRSAVPRLIRYALRFLEKISGYALPRNFHTALFDFFAASALIKTDVIFLHPGTILPRCLRRSAHLKAVSVSFATTAHFATNAQLEGEEMAYLDITDYRGTYGQYAKKFLHANAPAPDHLIAISEFVQESYISHRYPSERITFAIPDIDIHRFTPCATPPTFFRVLYVAYTTPLKGLHYLLDAWESLKLPEAELVLVGGWGDMPDELKRRYEKRIAADPSIKWVGPSHTPEKYYHEASALAFPSLTEGNSHVVMEAMACGLPVVTTENAQGIVEDGKTGFTVPIRDSQALAEKIKYLYEHREEAAAMGRAARRAVEQKKPFGEAVYEIYREIMKREGRTA
jgi:glycosyltransferase involved in cell wall biosynthesis